MSKSIMKKDKLIGLSDSDKKVLAKMGIDVGLSLKAYCERVLERHVVEHGKVTDVSDKRTRHLTPDECFQPLSIEVDLSSDEPATIHNLKTGEKTKLSEPPKMRSFVEDNEKKVLKDMQALEENIFSETHKPYSIPIKDKKGKFERVEPNIYTNGTVFECRRMVAEKGLISSYFRTIEEARKAKKN